LNAFAIIRWPKPTYADWTLASTREASEQSVLQAHVVSWARPAEWRSTDCYLPFVTFQTKMWINNKNRIPHPSTALL
jgi:hypothetical protein